MVKTQNSANGACLRQAGAVQEGIQAGPSPGGLEMGASVAKVARGYDSYLAVGMEVPYGLPREGKAVPANTGGRRTSARNFTGT